MVLTKNELAHRQSLPLEAKIIKSIKTIEKEW